MISWVMVTVIGQDQYDGLLERCLVGIERITAPQRERERQRERGRCGRERERGSERKRGG